MSVCSARAAVDMRASAVVSGHRRSASSKPRCVPSICPYLSRPGPSRRSVCVRAEQQESAKGYAEEVTSTGPTEAASRETMRNIEVAGPDVSSEPSRSAASYVAEVTPSDAPGPATTQTVYAAGPDEQQRKSMLEDTKEFLRLELDRIFTTGRVTRARYADNMTFEDSVVRYTSLDGYVFNVQLLQNIFETSFVLHNIEVEGNQVVTRWTMTLRFKFVPWQPQLTFTGRSFYDVDTLTNRITAQRDVWDAVEDNKYLSLEGLLFVIQQATFLQQTPSLDSPIYSVLRKTREYEVRKYNPYMVAEVDMPSTSGVADGTGFNDLAGYIFGGNVSRERMEMTTPVITTPKEDAGDAGKMQFVMENKYGLDTASVPMPNDPKVRRKLQEGGIVAAITFSGLPLNLQVTAAERRLRGALLVDGLKPEPGYKLARYNDPFTLPAFRRNEVLIRLEEFEF